MPNTRTTLSGARPFFFGEAGDRRKTRINRRAAAGAALALFLLTPLAPVPVSAADTLTFTPVADTYVEAGRPTTNFGSATTIQTDNSPIKHALLKFAVSGIGASAVASAKLRLYNVDSSSAGGVFYRVLDNSWGETAVTWNTAPAVAGNALASLGAVSPNIWYEVNLTSLVMGDGTYSIRVTSSSTNGADYTSRQGTATFRPQLVVTVQAPAADTVAPVVSITSPATGATVSGGITVQANASDNIGVTRVDLFIDGVLRGTDTTWPYSFPWDTTTASNGSHNLVPVASDAAGNTSTSTTVAVNVNNATADTTPPSIPTNLQGSAPTATRVDLSWTASTDNVAVDHYGIVRDGAEIGTATATSQSDTTASPGTTYGYSVRAYDAAGNFSLPSSTVSVTTSAAPPASFSFTAAGDHGANARSDASLATLNGSGSSFYLALGDLDYDETPTDQAWCEYVTSRLPALGPTFPFQLVSGNHEEQGGVNGYIVNHASCLPDRLGSTLGVANQYGAEYYFDYPNGAPLVRAIMIAPHITVENVHYEYSPGTLHHQWLVSAIDGARASGIPWVVVGMHHPCISAGEKLCGMANLMNLLVQKKVDLVLQAHDHNYQRSKQLALNPSSCLAVPINAYDPDCVVDDGGDGLYPKGAGSVTVIAGTFGRGLYPVSAADPEAPYFARTDSTSWGFTKYTVTADRIDARFVNSIGSFTDAFSIVSGGTPQVDSSPPTTPSGLAATPLGGTRIDLSWTASTDNAAMDHYSIFRGGGLLGSSATSSYSDTSVVPGGTYSYSVKAYDSAGNPSTPSETVTATAPSAVTTLTFSPAADAYILAASPTANYGTRSSLQVDNSPIAHSLMRFSVTGIGSRRVATAKLRLYNVNESSAGGVFYRVSDNSWGETTVNWSNAPPAVGSALASLGTVIINNWYEVDLSSGITGDGVYGYRITSTSSNGADYTSKEGSTAFRPQLVVTLQP
jgi:chitodextrinase